MAAISGQLPEPLFLALFDDDEYGRYEHEAYAARMRLAADRRTNFNGD